MSGSKSSPPADARAPMAADEPLGLTVHSLPQWDATAAERTAATRSGRLKMLAVLLVCAAPVIASYFTYYVVRPEGRRNYGELIDPQRPLPAALQGLDAQGRTVSLPTLKDQWLLISVADSACDADCERHLYLQRQLREGLGKEKGRLDWVWLRTGNAELTPALQSATAQATVLRVDEAALASWLVPAPGQRLADHLYVVDPLGNWMMRFPAQADPARVRRDLDRLLRASAFWDKEGRP
ncbi:SCO family protein [Hydrogenophaga sp. OTU3427]|uniref:SCO family protein n=1 Tax=Hydrogenophaga sp. OTU3427 TaxID=3043856 RepID=UPI00313CCD8B